MEKNVLLLTEDHMTCIEDNPNGTKDIIKGFQLFEVGDEKLKDANYLIIDKQKIPLKKVKNTCHIVKSELYNNIYYPIDMYEKYYEEDFKNLIKDIVWKIGATHVKIYSKREESNIIRKESDTKVESKIKYKGVKAEFYRKYRDSDNSQLDINEECILDLKRSKEEAKESKMTTEEFSDWINNKNINEQALSTFWHHIEDFKKSGEAYGSFEFEEKKSEYSKTVYKTYNDIKAGIDGLPINLGFIKNDLSVNYNRLEENERKLAKEFFVQIEF